MRRSASSGMGLEPGTDAKDAWHVDFECETMRISHEAIYQTLVVQVADAPRRELTACLRTAVRPARESTSWACGAIRLERRYDLPSIKPMTRRWGQLGRRPEPGSDSSASVRWSSARQLYAAALPRMERRGDATEHEERAGAGMPIAAICTHLPGLNLAANGVCAGRSPGIAERRSMPAVSRSIGVQISLRVVATILPKGHQPRTQPQTPTLAALKTRGWKTFDRGA